MPAAGRVILTDKPVVGSPFTDRSMARRLGSIEFETDRSALSDVDITFRAAGHPGMPPAGRTGSVARSRFCHAPPRQSIGPREQIQLSAVTSGCRYM